MADNVAPISMPGSFANRTDKGAAQRVQRIQRDAKIQEASGGSYNERNTLNQLAQGAPTEVQTASASMPRPTSGKMLDQMQPSGLLSGANPNAVLSNGAQGGPGAGVEINQLPVDSPNQAALLARAMYLANPTPQLRRIVEGFNEENSSGV